MTITKRQLKRLIREERRKLMTEQRVPQGLIENLNNAMTAILDHLENNADRRADPEDIPLQALEIIEEEVAGFREYLGSGYDASGGSSWMREADGSTKKYDDDSALKGNQSKLPDGLQKGIIDKTVEDREEQEEEDREEKNEGAALGNMPDSWRQILGNCLGDK